MDIVVKTSARGAALDWGAGKRPCAVGRGGIGVKGGEGDGITPVGRFAIRRVLYRADRVSLRTALPASAIAEDDGWCDAPNDPAYNTPVKLPCAASHERLWREDRLYDVVVVLGFNDDPVIAGKGSAIFLHVARPDYGPTEGCVALALPDLSELLAKLSPGDAIRITN